MEVKLSNTWKIIGCIMNTNYEHTLKYRIPHCIVEYTNASKSDFIVNDAYGSSAIFALSEVN